MSATAAPYGLMPVYHPSGVGVRLTETGTITTGYATTIYQNAPIKIAADGSIQLAAVNDRFIGAFAGVQYVDSNGQPQLSPKWPASTTATQIVAKYTRDQKQRYQIQGNGPVDQDDMGEQFDCTTTTAGNTTTGMSSVALDVASSAANAGLRIIGLAQDVGNAWSDAYTDVIVEISEHQDTADVAAY